MNNVHIIRRIPLLISSRHHLGCVVGGRHEELSGTVEVSFENKFLFRLRGQDMIPLSQREHWDSNILKRLSII